ncbi:MAG: alpha/beta fold hydrolase [Burkholderiales bacterium]
MTDALVARYRDVMLAPGAHAAMLARMAQSILVPPEPMLKTIQAPTLLIWGEKDAMIPYANAGDHMRLLPHATLKSFPKLGHLPHEEALAESINPVAAFLTRTETK